MCFASSITEFSASFSGLPNMAIESPSVFLSSPRTIITDRQILHFLLLITSMDEISISTSSKSNGAQEMHLLPCNINYNGRASVNAYFFIEELDTNQSANVNDSANGKINMHSILMFIELANWSLTFILMYELAKGLFGGWLFDELHAPSRS